jgi:hypothetical protein
MTCLSKNKWQKNHKLNKSSSKIKVIDDPSHTSNDKIKSPDYTILTKEVVGYTKYCKWLII